MERHHVINFGAGPSALPHDVLEEARNGLINYNGTGIGITEISHRSKDFSALVSDLENQIRTQLRVPETHSIIFTQGGGSAQFSAVVLNLLARDRLLRPNVHPSDVVMDFVVTGSWSKKAMEEAHRLGGQAKVNVVTDGRKLSGDGKSFVGIPAHPDFNFSPEPAFIYYCENETVDGVQFSHEAASPAAFPFEVLKSTYKRDLLPLVADYSSSFMSRPIPHLEDHAVIFAGAQKNIGPAGLTIVIVRKDCLVDVDAATLLGAPPVPLTMAYKTLASSNSLYNTPPMFPMYVALLVLKRLAKGGGVEGAAKVNTEKMQKVYALVKEGQDKGLFRLKVNEGSRSWMNVVFVCTDAEQEKEFLENAEKQGLKGMKGHRSVGGIRVSLYNAITPEDVSKLGTYIHNFIKSHS